MSAESLLEGLTDAQTEAVTHGDGPLLVVAGPGSGKTRVITHRAGHLARTVTDAYHILAITFTNKAAAEMAERMARLAVGRGVTCSTFHSFCARLLRIHAERAGIEPNFSIFDTSDQLAAMKQAIERADLSAENFPPAKVLGKISRAKNDMRSAADLAVAAAASGEWSNRRIVEIYEAYEAVLAEQNGLDFDDLLVKTARLLGDDPELRAQLQDRYRYVLVDEYQDTNHAQYLIARGLALEHERSPIGENQPGPDQQHPTLADGDAVVIGADQAGALRDQQQAASRAVVYILGDLCDDLARQVGADAGD